MLLTAERTDLSPAAFVSRYAGVFVVFDSVTQDSGNVSYGVECAGQRFFVKTAGAPTNSRTNLAHEARVELLRNTIRIARSVSDAALPLLHRVIESPEGPLLVYEWLEGELIGGTRRLEPASAFFRFRALPWQERAAALDVILRLYVHLAALGWIATDFYDGCLMYDFERRRMRVIDLDHYRDAPFINTMGRMFGSSRFMAPEEHQLGAQVDQRTTVFSLGRTLQQFLPEHAGPVASRACEVEPTRRFESVADLYRAWVEVVPE